MKKTIILIIIFTAGLLAQDGAFIAPVLKSAKAYKGGIIGGVRVGWVINDKIVLGGAYYSLLNNIYTNDFDPKTNSPFCIEFTMGGLDLEYIFYSTEYISLSAELFAGGGGVKYTLPKQENKYNTVGGNNLLIWEPALNIDHKINNWFNITLGVGYRFVSSFKDYYSLSKHDFESPYASLNLKFGVY